LLTLLVLIGGFLGWALWTKRGMERQVGQEWGAENEEAKPANPGSGRAGTSPADLDDGAAAEAVGAVPDTMLSTPVSRPLDTSPRTQPQGADAPASEQAASSNSTFVAVGGQRLDGGAPAGVAPAPTSQAPGDVSAGADRDGVGPGAVPPGPDASAPGRTDPRSSRDTSRPAPETGAGTSGNQGGPAEATLERPYALHVGSYRTIEKANEDIANLQKRGYEGRAVRTDLGSKGVWYRVYVGAYPSRAVALAASRSLLALPEYKYAQVVRVPRP
jgi:cell division protein FtsN